MLYKTNTERRLAELVSRIPNNDKCQAMMIGATATAGIIAQLSPYFEKGETIDAQSTNVMVSAIGAKVRNTAEILSFRSKK